MKSAVAFVLASLACSGHALADTTAPRAGRESKGRGIVMLKWRATDGDNESINITLTADGRLVGRVVFDTRTEDAATAASGCESRVVSRTKIEFFCGAAYTWFEAELRNGLLTFSRVSDDAAALHESQPRAPSVQTIASTHVTGQSLAAVRGNRPRK